MKIFKTECLLNSKLPNTHACSSATQEFCPNPLLWTVLSEKTCNKATGLFENNKETDQLTGLVLPFLDC